MPIPRISNNAANSIGASLRYEQNGKTQNPLIPNLLPEPIDFTGWTTSGAASVGAPNEVNIPTGLAGGLKLVNSIDAGASYRVTIVVEQDAPTAAANTLRIILNSTVPVTASYKIHTQTLSQGSNSFTFIVNKSSNLSDANSIEMEWGSATHDVALTFKKMEFKKCPTTRVLKKGVGLDTFTAATEGANAWKIVALAEGAAPPTLGALTANNISPADCTKLIGIIFDSGTEIMGDFTEINVSKGFWKIYMKLPKN
mgnify:CR=1 FL=1|tara:strand:+ start:3264 stop:4028 length:765 start_codon:yes stop_codon:yes gene_type:complete